MRDKKNADNYMPILLFVLILLLLAGSLFSLFFSENKHPDQRFCAEIFSEGKLVASIPLWQVRSPYTLEVSCSGGGRNTILISSSQVSVLQASCPDKICVHRGAISGTMLPIVCLPNRLVVQLRAETDETDLPDGFTY